MAKFNIYKIREGEKENLLYRFEKTSLKEQAFKNLDGYKLTFYFSEKPDEVAIWWIDFYKDFLPDEFNGLKNKIYFGALTAEKRDSFFVISLSKSHFYIKDYCDPDFGLNVAERIANEKDVKLKNAKFFKNKRSKVITSYHNDSSIDFESGESMHFLKARSIDTQKWGKTVSFGQSVMFTLDDDYTRLPSLINDILAELKKPAKIKLPKVIPVVDENEIKKLDQKLAEAIEQEQSSGSIEESQFTLHGVDFIFSDENEYSFFIAGNFGDKSPKGILSLGRLHDFLSKRSLTIRDNLNDLKITVHKEHSRDHSEDFKNYLEYVDEQDNICLIDGKWYRFNQSYLDYLKQEVDLVPCDISIHPEQLPTEEKYLKIKERDGFVIIHTDLETVDRKYSIEAGDMVKEDTLYIVKKGQPKQLNYAIDQAMASMNYLQENNRKVVLSGVKHEIKNICLLLLLDRKRDLKHLFDLNSLVFHMKIIDWQRIARNARFTHSVIVEQFKG